MGVPLPNLETAAKNGNSAAGSCLWECRCQTRKLGRWYWPPEWCCQKWKLQPKMETRPPDPACGSAVAKLRNYAGGTWPMGVVLPKMETAAKNGNSAMGECTHPPLQTIMDNHPNLEVGACGTKCPGKFQCKVSDYHNLQCPPFLFQSIWPYSFQMNSRDSACTSLHVQQVQLA